MNKHLALVLCLFWMDVTVATAQHSVAREWNEALLFAIRNDFARPTVHARNLFHSSIAMYDAWAVYDAISEPFLIGKSVGQYTSTFSGITSPADMEVARHEAISYAMYRLLKQRFEFSPGKAISYTYFDSLFSTMGYDPAITSIDYTTGSPAALGNHIAAEIIAFGQQDGSNETFGYGNLSYLPVNAPIDPVTFGNPRMTDPNRWQPLTLGTFIDQSGNALPINTPEFLGAEWGQVVPFALTDDVKTHHLRDGFDYVVYHDPGHPPYLDTLASGGLSDLYRWGFSLVAIWAGHLNPDDGVMWDVSPASIGNIPVQDLPISFEEYPAFYKLYEGGDIGMGHSLNPATGLPYAPQIVSRGDYTRVLSEFWADGPDSETPPGHWFTILNYVNDHPLFERRYKGMGPIMDSLEWDVKSYFAMGGAVHDAAITAWGIKGRYDYVRPISAIRWMADRGLQAGGFDLHPGYIEVVEEGDPLAGEEGENIGKIKIMTWLAHDHIPDPELNHAGAGWVLAEDWWPYQRPTFVTPPFAGYISGHSTFSRSAAEIMTYLTGSAYFPGGMGEFRAPANEFLVFENGPSTDVILQWATYQDASDQCSLSRIWGGIHPPLDDIVGRKLGVRIAADAMKLADEYFSGLVTSIEPHPTHSEFPFTARLLPNYPNPFNPTTVIPFDMSQPMHVTIAVYDVLGRRVAELVNGTRAAGSNQVTFDASNLTSGMYLYRLTADGIHETRRMMIVK